MPRCTLCKKLLPPIICEPTEDGKTHVCVFCKRETDEIWYTDSNGKKNPLKKNNCVKEYDVYLKKIAEKPNVKKIITGEFDEEVKNSSS